MKAHSGLCQQDKLAQPGPERNRMTRELSLTRFRNGVKLCCIMQYAWTCSVAVPEGKEIVRRQLASTRQSFGFDKTSMDIDHRGKCYASQPRELPNFS